MIHFTPKDFMTSRVLTMTQAARLANKKVAAYARTSIPTFAGMVIHTPPFTLRAPQYLPCDGSRQLKVTWPELASLIPATHPDFMTADFALPLIEHSFIATGVR